MMMTTKPFAVGDRVLTEMHCREPGKTGGWRTDYIPGTIIKVNQTTARVKLDEYYFAQEHTLSFARFQKIGYDND